MTTSYEMAQMFSGDPGFFDILKSVGGKILKGAVKGIPFIGGIASEFIDPVLDTLVGEPEAEHYDDEEEGEDW